ncbi:hypothetical protein EVG20_g10661 [Dentipellis fragilis]|uniref:DUF6533 domain-containing protein n=1 Tax=Dentipellis fragilis TaxID=205917 RepID=A0A4Y9XQ12_9AGAM|nr:hypothetical protein EVG20_g10661 [Dentipellis fragilis]
MLPARLDRAPDVSPMAELSIGIARELQVNYYLSLIYFTILYYDYLVTFSAEVEYFWLQPRRLNWPSALFFVNRYGALLGHIPFVIEVFIYPIICVPLGARQFCSGVHKYHQPYAALLQLVVVALCVIRVSAMYNHNRLVLGYLIILIIGCAILSCWVIFAGVHKDPLVLLGHGAAGCNPLHSQSQSTRLAIAWSGLLMFDCSVFILTVAKAFQIGRQYPGSLIHVLLRDGTLYFAMLFFANLSNILMYLNAAPLLKDTNTVLTNVLSTTAISRLMLNLRAAHEKSKQSWMTESSISRLLEVSGPSEV